MAAVVHVEDQVVVVDHELLLDGSAGVKFPARRQEPRTEAIAVEAVNDVFEAVARPVVFREDGPLVVVLADDARQRRRAQEARRRDRERIRRVLDLRGRGERRVLRRRRQLAVSLAAVAVGEDARIEPLDGAKLTQRGGVRVRARSDRRDEEIVKATHPPPDDVVQVPIHVVVSTRGVDERQLDDVRGLLHDRVRRCAYGVVGAAAALRDVQRVSRGHEALSVLGELRQLTVISDGDRHQAVRDDEVATPGGQRHGAARGHRTGRRDGDGPGIVATTSARVTVARLVSSRPGGAPAGGRVARALRGIRTQAPATARTAAGARGRTPLVTLDWRRGVP